MRKLQSISWSIVLILILAIGFLLVTGDKNASSESQTIDLTSFSEELQSEADGIYEIILPIEFSTEKNTELAKIKSQKWYLIETKNNTPTFWSSNKIGLDSSIQKCEDFPVLYTFGDDTYMAFQNRENVYLAFRLANDGKPHKRLAKKYPELSNSKLNTDSFSGTYSKSFVIEYTNSSKTSSTLSIIAAICGTLLFFLTLFYVKTNSQSQWISAGTSLALSILTFLATNYAAPIFYFLDSSSFSVLGDEKTIFILLLHFTCLASILVVALNISRKLPRIASSIILAAGLFFIADFFISVNTGLIQKTSISFDFEKLFSLNTYSFWALALIGVSFFLLWMFCYQSKISQHIKKPSSLIGVAIGLLVFILFQLIDGHRNLASLGLPILLVLVSIIVIAVSSKRKSIYLHFVLTIIISSTLIYNGQRERENAKAKSFASSLIENKDLRAEGILKSIENQLAQEFLTPEDYENFIFKKDLIESRLKHLYFSNYLEKYELKLLTYGPHGENINHSNIYDFTALDSLYNNHSSRTESDYFYQLDNPTSVNGYLAKYENCDIDGHFGTTFILLQPRVVQSEFLYPEVFANQKSKELLSLEDYSYGIYFDNKLISQKGKFPYLLESAPDDSRNSMFAIGETRHTKFTNEDYQVVLSKPENRLKSWMSVLTFSLIILLPLSILLSLLAGFVLSKDHPLAVAFLPGTSKYLSSRIQTSLTVILLAALLLSVYIIISYIRTNYNQSLETQLLTKIKSISIQMQNKVDLEQKLGNDEQRTLILNEESSTYNVDINLYDKSGKLLSSTKPYLTEEQILSSYMNPKAYSRLLLNKSSQLLIQEELEGSKYLSAYIPLFDEKNDVIGYVNTPFFAKNEQLNKQISNLVVNILNIYFLLLLGGIFLAYIISHQISKPLVLIREKIASTVLQGQNELISYTRDDEIGQLIKQYNKMVLELEESANQMAESEREGAWREMAKQVAHEIKNPLTPMKLSIQHLQRAYDAGPSEKLNVLFAKTSKLLVEQINSLSTMASEFSNFAQMPEDKIERFDVSEVLNGTVELFKRSENTEITSNIDDHKFIIADPEQIRRVFNNLIKNAIQAIPEDRKGMISVKLVSSDSSVHISVADNGKGIPKENYKKVFVPNFSTKNSGMGLGLAICRKIIDTAKGSISFESKINEGTTFNIKLPLDEKS